MIHASKWTKQNAHETKEETEETPDNGEGFPSGQPKGCKDGGD